MEKKIYFAPEVKFHQLRGNAVMQAASGKDGGEEVDFGGENEDLSKAFFDVSFDED